MRFVFRLFVKLVVLAVAAWLLATGALFVIMCLPPERFATVVAHLPPPLVMAVLPFEPLWKFARRGSLRVGDVAPDFDLARHDNPTLRENLATHRGTRPVVLVFGSYT